MASYKNNFYQSVLVDLINRNQMTNIVQVGANDGRINDPLFEVVMRHSDSTKIALVEPQTEVLSFLAENYHAHPQASIWNYAIGSSGALTLYRLKPHYYDVFIKRYLTDSPSYRVPSGFTSSSKEHVLKHVSGNLPFGLSIMEAIEEIEVPMINLDQLLQKTDWEEKRVDVLQIDTEGMDDIVIYECNIHKLKPTVINFEDMHLSEARYKGICKMLSSFGYYIYKYSESDTLASLLKAVA